jgi:hypothetical protein
MILSSTSDLIRVLTSSASAINVHVSWVDITTTTFTPGRTNTSISSLTTTTIVASPAASTQRQVKTITISNFGASIANSITVIHTDGTNVASVYQRNLLPGESIAYDGNSWIAYSSGGIPYVNKTFITDGWQSLPSVSTTRISDNSFSVGYDATGYIQKGYKLKLIISGLTKYFDIFSLSYGAGVTTFTTFANSDYAVTAIPTELFWSPEDMPFGFPDTFNWVSTKTGFSANPTNLVERFRVTGKKVKCEIRWATGGTSNATTLTWSLPCQAATITNMRWFSSARVVDNGSAVANPGLMYIDSGATVCDCFSSFAGGVWTASSTKYITIGNIEYEF